MRRNASTSFSALSGIVFLFLLLIVFVLILTNQFLIDFLQKKEPLSAPVLVLSALFVVVLLIILGVNIFRLVSDMRAQVPGVRFKARLVLFFGALVLLSGLPPLVLTASILRNAFDVWFIHDTTSSLDYGIDTALAYYQDKTASLKAFSSTQSLPGLVRSLKRDPDTTWNRIRELNTDIQALQVFSSNGTGQQEFGDKDLWIKPDELSTWRNDQVEKVDSGGQSMLRVSAVVNPAPGVPDVRLVFGFRLPPGFDERGSLLSQTRQKLAEIKNLPISFPLLVFAIYLLFFAPLFLIALMISFYVADEVVRPLVHMEQAVRRVAQGDYGTRLLARRSDAMGHFVTSFNDMVGELERSRASLKQSERLQTWQDIAQRMAHEIKNPLTPIQLAAERIRRKYQSQGTEFDRILDEATATIVQEVGAIAKLLTEFRDFARLPQPVPDFVSLREIVSGTWQIYDGIGPVRLDMSGVSEDTQLIVDRVQFMQVLKNLFQNAFDAIGSQDGVIQVRAFSMDRIGTPVLRLQIRDSGSGMPPEILKDIFNPYFTTKKQGSGLGLAIVEKIILDHGGRIWAESQPGQGTSFFIDLPRHNGVIV